MTEAPPRQIAVGDVAAWWPVPGASSHKYTRGVVGIDTGSEDYPGAALLSIAGALGAGPGMVRYLGAAPRDLILGRFPASFWSLGGSKLWWSDQAGGSARMPRRGWPVL